MPSYLAFYPRKNEQSGIIESICLKCYRTVTPLPEADLEQSERKHQCSAKALEAKAKSLRRTLKPMRRFMRE